MSDRETDKMIIQLFQLLTDEEKEEVLEHLGGGDYAKNEKEV